MNTYEIKTRFFADNRSVNLTEVIRLDNFSYAHIYELCQCKTRELAEAMVKNLENAKGRVYRRAAAFEEAIL